MAIEQRRKMPGLVFPVVLILVGILWLLDNLNMTGGNWFQSLVRFWPLLLVLWGLENWITERGITGPVILIGIGGLFLLTSFNVIGGNALGWAMRLWPVLLVAVGMEILFGRRSVWLSGLGLLLTLGLLGAVVLISL
jgi:hypothetical protein